LIIIASEKVLRLGLAAVRADLYITFDPHFSMLCELKFCEHARRAWRSSFCMSEEQKLGVPEAELRLDPP
jgi:hypothetical protein